MRSPNAQGRAVPGLLPALILFWVGTAAAFGAAVELSFQENPAATGWRRLGDPDLFVWDKEAGVLRAKWDSSRPNSAFYLPLGRTLTRAESFAVECELIFEEIRAGADPAKPFSFELAMGFFSAADLADPDFRRGDGVSARNLAELDFFPDAGYGPTLWPMAISSEGRFNYNSPEDFVILELPLKEPLTLRLEYDAEAQSLVASVRRGGDWLLAPHRTPLAESFGDFRVDAAGLCSYSDAGAGGSLFAAALVRRLRVETPEPPVRELRLEFAGKRPRLCFQAAGGWRYALERSVDLLRWEETASAVVEEAGAAALEDSAPPERKAFYRIRAERQ